MPGDDGTGPFGEGPFTGRGIGRSSGGRGMGRGADRCRGMGKGHRIGRSGISGGGSLPEDEYQSYPAQPK